MKVQTSGSLSLLFALSIGIDPPGVSDNPPPVAKKNRMHLVVHDHEDIVMRYRDEESSTAVSDVRAVVLSSL